MTGTQWLLRAAKANSVAAHRELELVGPRLHALADGDDRAATLYGVVLAFHLDDEAGRLAGRLLDADVFVRQRHETAADAHAE